MALKDALQSLRRNKETAPVLSEHVNIFKYQLICYIFFLYLKWAKEIGDDSIFKVTKLDDISFSDEDDFNDVG